MKTIDFGIYTQTRQRLILSVVGAVLAVSTLGLVGAWVLFQYGPLAYYQVMSVGAVAYLVSIHLIQHAVQGNLRDMGRIGGSVFGALSSIFFLLGLFLSASVVFQSLYLVETHAIVAGIGFCLTIVGVGIGLGWTDMKSKQSST